MTRAELARHVRDIKARARSGRCATAAATYDMLVRYHGRGLTKAARRRLGAVVDRCFKSPGFRPSEPDRMNGARRRR